MRWSAIGTLALLLAATSVSAQMPLVTRTPPYVEVISSDAWLCRQVATNLGESTLLASAIIARFDGAMSRDGNDGVQIRPSEHRIGEAIAAFAIDGSGGVIYVSDS